MRIIARSTLHSFVRNRVQPGQQKAVNSHLDAWYKLVTNAQWKNSAELKSQFRSASIVSAERVVFNVKGNDFRLIVSINYHYRAVQIMWLGTHKEYDRISAAEVEYDKARYTDPPHSN